MDALERQLGAVTRHLDRRELFYVFTGELALRMLGCTDTVGTIELLVNLTAEERGRFFDFLEQEGYETRSRWRGPVTFSPRAGGAALRLRLAGSAADMATIGRRVPVTLGYVSLFIPSYEDLVLNLLSDAEMGEREVAAFYLRFQNYMDMEYLVTGARERSVYPRFVRMKIRAGKLAGG
ncbi:MAG: nucleotidyltransferase family protein [Euryarchaeota archaeon]|nr:nucleotidyltransferase family protein [Euryarchaeota archaeon]